MAVETTSAGHRDGRPGVGRNTRPDSYSKDNTERTFGGQERASRPLGEGRTGAYSGTPEKPFEDHGSKARSKSRNRKRGDRGRARPLNDEERLARSLRQPPQRTPDVAYQPANGRNTAIAESPATAKDPVRNPARN